MSDYIAEHKVPRYSVTRMTNRDPDFYQVLGPWLSRREVVDELGGPVWDDDGKEWYVAHNEDGPLGMVAVHRRTVCSLYVAPGARGQLAGTTLLVRALIDHQGELKAMATDASLPLFSSAGFREVGARGRYHRMVRK